MTPQDQEKMTEERAREIVAQYSSYIGTELKTEITSESLTFLIGTAVGHLSGLEDERRRAAGLVEAFEEIRDKDQIDVILDPTWSQRIAAQALQAYHATTDNVAAILDADKEQEMRG